MVTAQSRSCQETLFAVSVAQGAVRRAGRAPPQTRSARRCLAGGRSWLSLAARTCAKGSKGGEGCSSPQSRAVGIAATGIRPSRGGARRAASGDAPGERTYERVSVAEEVVVPGICCSARVTSGLGATLRRSPPPAAVLALRGALGLGTADGAGTQSKPSRAQRSHLRAMGPSGHWPGSKLTHLDFVDLQRTQTRVGGGIRD